MVRFHHHSTQTSNKYHLGGQWIGPFITRETSWDRDRRNWLFSAVSVGIWTPHPPVLIRISLDKSPLNQLRVKNLFFHWSSKHFAINTNILFMKKAINLSVWIKEIRTLLVMLHSICSKMQRVNRLRPVPYFPDMSGWTSGQIFSGEVRFFPDIDRGTSSGDFVNYAEPTTHVFCCF